MVYTQSRAALIALLIVAVAIGVLHGVRLRVLAVAVCGVIALGSLVLPHSLPQRVDALSDGGELATHQLRDDSSLRGRTSENLAGLRHVGATTRCSASAPTTSRSTTRPTPRRSGSTSAPRARGAHNLYLESLPRPGCSGRPRSSACSGCAQRRLAGARPPAGPRRPARRGPGVALGAFLICALTLHSAYARYEWIFLGLGLAAGRLARRPAR